MIHWELETRCCSSNLYETEGSGKRNFWSLETLFSDPLELYRETVIYLMHRPMQDTSQEVHNISDYNVIALKFDLLQWKQHSQSSKCYLLLEFLLLGCLLQIFKRDEFICLWSIWIIFMALLHWPFQALQQSTQVNWGRHRTPNPSATLAWKDAEKVSKITRLSTMK